MGQALDSIENLMRQNRPPNSPGDKQIRQHARYAAHAHWFLLSGFVSRENKGAVILIPKLKVASSSLVGRSISYLQNRRVTKGAMTNINSDREENEQLAGLSRQTGLYRPLALEGINELFAEIAKYDEDKRLETIP